MGEIRSLADHAGSDWNKWQEKARIGLVPESEELFPSWKPSHPDWKTRDQLRRTASWYEAIVEALSPPDPFARFRPHLAVPIVWWAEEHAPDAVDVRYRTHPFDPAKAAVLLHTPVANLRSMFEATCKQCKQKASQVWADIRSYFSTMAEQAAAALAERESEERRVRLLASLPEEARLQTILRYEAHVSRDIERTLNQLSRARGEA